jgi:hypothetical protein
MALLIHPLRSAYLLPNYQIDILLSILSLLMDTIFVCCTTQRAREQEQQQKQSEGIRSHKRSDEKRLI